MRTREKLKNSLMFLKNKRIALYGTGKNAENIIEFLPELNIVGILDRVKMDGDVNGIPIIDWDDIKSDEIYAIIICSATKYERIIGERIMLRCDGLNLKIYNLDGDDIQQILLKEAYYDGNSRFFPAGYINENMQKLSQKIELYDAISFDMFDTLVMRKTLVPTDVFQIVDNKAKEKEIGICNFKKKRRTAELECIHGNIDDIYIKLEELYGIERDICNKLKELEIETELEILIPRYDVVQVMKYAYELGKEVSIISDMYLSATMLDRILKKLGIDCYSKIYVSCEYKCSKSNGLFEVYKNENFTNGKKLHIGDNWDADILGAKNSGIDAYYIMNSYDLLNASNWRRLLKYENIFECREVLGNLCSYLLNSPFSLNNQYGNICISTEKDLVNTFVSPIANIYVNKLCEYVKQENYSGVLLGARDGFLIKKIMDEISSDKNICLPYFYFLTSRKIILKTTIGLNDDLEWLERYSSDKKVSTVLSNLFDEKKEKGENEEDFLKRVKPSIIQKANNKKEMYLKYLQDLKIDIDGKYLFCDLISSGTVHRGINKLFAKELDGFYLYNIIIPSESKLKVHSIYETKKYDEVYDSVNLFEKFFTSLVPSVSDIGDDGKFIFEDEERTEEELNLVENAHEWIIEWINNNSRLGHECMSISAEFWLDLLKMKNRVLYVESAAFINDMELIDSVTGNRLRVI